MVTTVGSLSHIPIPHTYVMYIIVCISNQKHKPHYYTTSTCGACASDFHSSIKTNTMVRHPLSAVLLCSLIFLKSEGFQSSAFLRRGTIVVSGTRLCGNKAGYDDGAVGQGPNWIEKSFPVETGEKVSVKKVEDYNLGISGASFQTGPLSKRMFQSILSQTSLEMGDEIRRAFTLYAMDFTAKEATRAALSQNGLEMVLQDEDEDQGMWGDIEAVRLYDEQTGIAFDALYDSLDDAVNDWSPGQPFDFVVRQVPAKIKEMSVDDLLQALDPDGALRLDAKGLNDEKQSEEILSAIFDDEAIVTLADLSNYNVQRTEQAPQEACLENEAFSGGLSRGYRVIKRDDLRLVDSGTDDESTIMHVMNALVAHGVLLVDLTNGGESMEAAIAFSQMWRAVEAFFHAIEDESVVAKLPVMATIEETGSKHAKVGYAAADDGSLIFLETRTERQSGAFLPKEAGDILGADGVASMQVAFDIVAQIAKDVVRIATAASSVENGAFSGQFSKASQAAALLAAELVDDGKSLTRNADFEVGEGAVSMSPHRICRYSENNREATSAAREVFGAHVDSSFITVVPVAAVSGLEVYDEEAEKWYRPELKARSDWEELQRRSGNDPSAVLEKMQDGTDIPWHCRYIALMPGEYLQLVTRDEVPAAVHRVVAARGERPRLSAPILLRGRPGTRFLPKRYIGGTLGNPLLEECNGKTMEEIHDLTQPSSFQ